MKRGIAVIVALLSFFILATRLTAEMKITPNGVSFPDNSTQSTACGPPWHRVLEDPDERFHLVMNNEAVLDRGTGLVWQRDTENQFINWYQACAYCYTLVRGNRKGWRLPTVEELSTLVDPGQTNPSLPPGHPFTNVKSSGYWSSTTNASYTDGAWFVYFRYGYVDYNFKANDNYVRCVRGGHGYDAR